MQMSISLNNSTVLVLVKSTKLRANSNSNSKLELDDFEPSWYHVTIICRWRGGLYDHPSLSFNQFHGKAGVISYSNF